MAIQKGNIRLYSKREALAKQCFWTPITLLSAFAAIKLAMAVSHFPGPMTALIVVLFAAICWILITGFQNIMFRSLRNAFLVDQYDNVLEYVGATRLFVKATTLETTVAQVIPHDLCRVTLTHGYTATMPNGAYFHVSTTVVLIPDKAHLQRYFLSFVRKQCTPLQVAGNIVESFLKPITSITPSRHRQKLPVLQQRLKTICLMRCGNGSNRWE